MDAPSKVSRKAITTDLELEMYEVLRNTLDYMTGRVVGVREYGELMAAIRDVLARVEYPKYRGGKPNGPVFP